MMEMLEKGQLKLPSVLLDAKVIDLNRWSTLVTDQSLALLASKNMKRMSDVMAKRNKGTRPPPVDVDLHHALRVRALSFRSLGQWGRVPVPLAFSLPHSHARPSLLSTCEMYTVIALFMHSAPVSSQSRTRRSLHARQ